MSSIILCCVTLCYILSVAGACRCFVPSRSPLMIAASNGQISMLRLLLKFEADITLKDKKGWSADDYAVMNGHHP